MSAGDVLPMTRRGPTGIFEAAIAGDRGQSNEPRLRLRFTFPGDHIVEVDDPYRYGRVLTGFRSASARRRDAPSRVREARRAPDHGRLDDGVHFAVWAPNADRVSVIGDFNGWDGRVHAMRLLMPNGIWEIFIPDVADGERYKYEIRTQTGAMLKKSDPFGFAFEVPPQSAAIVRDITRLRVAR